MQTLEAGNCERGFTLIELILVIFILALAAAAILPRFNLTKEDLRGEVRHLVAFISRLSTEALFRKKKIRLYYDLDNEKYWAAVLNEVEGVTRESALEDPLLKRVSISEGVELYEVAVRKGSRTNRGIVYTSFTPWGYRDKTYVYLKDRKDNIITVAIPSIGERIRVYEGYVE